ncbi:MAG: hypothetical protein M3X11_14185 [Acidobacteriota bacterium]|nr:hypothetical protein [Acidobacteriota bacterium]
MNILDENIPFGQRQPLSDRGIHFRQIAREIGRMGLDDREQIIPLLHRLRRPTFFTRDQDFSKSGLRHPGYCLVYLDVLPGQVAEYIHRFLRHSSFRTQAQRMGKVVRVRHGGLSWWEAGAKAERVVSW